MARNVFISYYARDRAVAEAVCSVLENADVRCWIEPRNSSGPYPVAMAKAFSESRALVLVFSAASIASYWVPHELSAAAKRNIPIIVLKIEDAPVPESAQPLLNGARWLDATTAPLAKHLQTLLSCLRSLPNVLEVAAPTETAEHHPVGPPECTTSRPGADRGPTGSGTATGRIQPDQLQYMIERQYDAAIASITDTAADGEKAEKPQSSLGRSERPLPECVSPDHSPSGSRPSTFILPPTTPRARRYGAVEVPEGIMDNVHFSVTSPSVVCPGEPFVMDVWAHLLSEWEQVMQRAREAAPGAKIEVKSKGPKRIGRGTTLVVRLTLPGLTVEDPEDTILWDGTIGNASFGVMVPRDAAMGPRRGQVMIYADELRVASVQFLIRVGTFQSGLHVVSSPEELHRKAFASYATEDRNDVLARVQGIRKAAPGLDVFLDVLSLRSGQYWEKELERFMLSSDVFYLFWSANAKRSKWVEEEWRCALDKRGLDFIDPVPLVSPEDVPPPPELAAKHFNDPLLVWMQKGR